LPEDAEVEQEGLAAREQQEEEEARVSKLQQRVETTVGMSTDDGAHAMLLSETWTEP
jgi:hypothetical protein